MLKVAAIQMVSGAEVDANLKIAASLIEEAAKQGAKLVVLPENFACMGYTEEDKLAIKEEDGKGRIQQFLQEQAHSRQLFLVGGTLPIISSDGKKVFSTNFVYDSFGHQLARYDKIHLFDVMVSDKEQYTESATVVPGNKVVVVATPIATLGLSVCYDVRFPELYRQLSHEGSTVITIPSAFTAVTGKAHWEILIRARAIENLAYVIAPGQGGKHPNGRETHGHSMIVDPWGKILACLEQGSGVITADIDLAYLHQIRKQFPAMEHRRL